MTIGERARQEQLERTATDPRRQFGWGVSPMASPEERAAFQAYEMLPKVAAGEIPVAALPESYGGRPTGTTRRAIRMQAEWDQSQQAALENQRLMQQMDLEQRRFTLSQRNQTLQEKQEARLQAAEAKAQDEALKVSEQADFALNEVLGGLDPTGNPIAGLDPDAPDYMQRRNDIIKRYPKAIKDDAFKTAISTTDKSYFDKLNFDQSRQISETQQATGLAKELAAVGKSIVDFTENGKINFEKANTALGEALKEGREREAETIDEREQRRNLRRQKASAETELVKIKSQVGRFEKLRPTENNLKELEAARVSQGIFEDEINRINRELGVEPQSATPTPAGQRPALGDIFGGQ